MPGHLARQRQKFHGELQRHGLAGRAARNGLALGLLALAELDVGAEAAVAHGDVEAGDRVPAENPDAGLAAFAVRRLAFAISGRRELAGVLALRIVRASDEGAELAELQRELACAAIRADPGIAAIRL